MLSMDFSGCLGSIVAHAAQVELFAGELLIRPAAHKALLESG
ncbi:hypothetical protein WMF26_19100 [Sorangium sp. So ce185]